jgi:DNA-binding NarL/FixJ family response regulator
LRFVQFAAHVPDDLCLTSLREIMALNKVQVHACHPQQQEQQPSSPVQQQWQPPAPWPPRVAAAATLHLTAMERLVLLAFTRCDTNDEIAALLGIAESTVKTHVKNLFRTNPGMSGEPQRDECACCWPAATNSIPARDRAGPGRS